MAIKQIKQLLSIAQAQIVPMLKQLRLKLTSNKQVLQLMNTIQTDQNSNSCRKEKPFEN